MKKPSLDIMILRALFARRGQPVSGGDLAEQAGVSRAAIWKHIEQLQAIGYPIEAQPHYGYRLLDPPDIWCADEITARLPAPAKKQIAWKPVLLPETISTNDLASREAHNGQDEGLVIAADHQTHGRGRHGRKWDAPKGSSLLASILLRPQWPLQHLTRLTILASVAIARAVETLCNLEVRIKWPNDLLIRDKKLGGILTEIATDPETIRFAVLGFGLNVSQTASDFPAALRATATSLYIETKHRYRRADLLLAILQSIDQCYHESFDKIRDQWTARCLSLGQTLTLQTPIGKKHGQAVGLDEHGALLLRTDSGLTETITAGDIV